MVTITAPTPTASVKLTTKDGREFSTEVQCTKEAKKAASLLALNTASENTLIHNAWDIAEAVKEVFGKDVAFEVLRAFDASNDELYEGDTMRFNRDNYSGLWGLFVFKDTPQGADFWIQLSEAAEAVIKA